MESLIVSKTDYEAGNYPKDVPMMIGIDVGMEGKGGLNVGKSPTKITIVVKPA